jgi:hypothetical protein
MNMCQLSRYVAASPRRQRRLESIISQSVQHLYRDSMIDLPGFNELFEH